MLKIKPREKKQLMMSDNHVEEFVERKPKKVLILPEYNTLTFPIEVVPTSLKSKGIQKQILEEGQGLQATDLSKIRYLHLGYILYENSELVEFDNNYALSQERLLKPRQTMLFMKECLLSMKLHEKALFKIAPEYAYGGKETLFSGINDERLNGVIPPHSTLIYYFEMTYLERRRPDPTNFEERLLYSEEDRLKGNEFYRLRNFKDALHLYNRSKAILEFADKEELEKEENKERFQSAVLKSYLNLAKAYIEAASDASIPVDKRESYISTAFLTLENKLLKRIQPEEAHYLRAKCHSLKQDFDRAIESVNTAIKIDPKHERAKQLLVTLTKKRQIAQQESNKKLRVGLKGFFDENAPLYPDAKPYRVEDEWKMQQEEDERVGRKAWFTSTGEMLYESNGLTFEDVTTN